MSLTGRSSCRRSSGHESADVSIPNENWDHEAWHVFLKRRKVIAASWRLREERPDAQLQLPRVVSDSLRAGAHVEHFQLLDPLGEGGFASVWDAKDGDSGERVALKILKPEIAALDAECRRFEEEVALLKRLRKSRCRRLLGPVDSFRYDVNGERRLVLKMPLMRGTVAERARELRAAGKPATPQQVLTWALQTLEALEDLHERDVVHRDIKPSNLLLDDQDEVVVADFGVARDAGRDRTLTRTGDSLGSDLYMAPEQRANARSATGKADVYALAITVHELLTGRVSPLPGKGIDGRLGPLLERMGAADPDRRPTAKEATAELRAVVSPGVASPEPVVEPEPKSEPNPLLVGIRQGPPGVLHEKWQEAFWWAMRRGLLTALDAGKLDEIAQQGVSREFIDETRSSYRRDIATVGKLIEAALENPELDDDDVIVIEKGRRGGCISRKEASDVARGQRSSVTRLVPPTGLDWLDRALSDTASGAARPNAPPLAVSTAPAPAPEPTRGPPSGGIPRPADGRTTGGSGVPAGTRGTPPGAVRPTGGVHTPGAPPVGRPGSAIGAPKSRDVSTVTPRPPLASTPRVEVVGPHRPPAATQPSIAAKAPSPARASLVPSPARSVAPPVAPSVAAPKPLVAGSRAAPSLTPREREHDPTERDFDALTRAFTANPLDAATITALERVTRALDRWLTLVEKAELALQSPRDAKEKVAILVCLGKWYGLELDRPDRAYERLVDASKIDPADQRARRVRAALFRRFGNRQAALRELQEAMRGRVSVEERAEINTEIGDMLMDDASQDSGGAGVARKHYTEALEARPEYVPALGGLVRVHAELEEWRGLANVLERRLKLTDDDDALAADHVRLAELYEKNLGEPQKAAQHYRDILLSSEPTSPATMSAHWKAEASLERLARQLGLWRDLVEIARAHVAAGRTHDARKLLDEAAAILSARRGGRKADFAVVHEGLGALHEAEQDAPRAALEFQLAYDLDPASPRTLRGCGDLAYAAGDLDRARAMFEGMLKLPLGGRSGATKADVLCRLGEIAEQRSELPVAKERAERALQLEPGHARANALRARLR